MRLRRCKVVIETALLSELRRHRCSRLAVSSLIRLERPPLSRLAEEETKNAVVHPRRSTGIDVV